MKLLGNGLAKAAVLWLTLMVGQALGGGLFFRGAPAIVRDGPLDAGQALLAVSAIDALLLALLAGRMRLRGWKLGLVLATVLFGVQTGQALIEAVVFNNDLHMSSAILFGGAAVNLLRDVLAGAAIALLWRGQSGAAPQLRGIVWKAPAVAALYVVCYFTAGGLIAWRSPAVRAFYAHVHEIDVNLLYGVQFGRGLIWCALAWLLARNQSGPCWRTALLTGVAFSAFMVPQLLFPNPVMPWPVRAVHMVEVGVSNFVFGVLAALILLGGAKDASTSAAAAPEPHTSPA